VGVGPGEGVPDPPNPAVPFGDPRPVGPSYPLVAVHIIVVHDPSLPDVMSWELVELKLAYGTDCGFATPAIPPASAMALAIRGDDRLVPPTCHHPVDPLYGVES
jgi:hypothetical protein